MSNLIKLEVMMSVDEYNRFEKVLKFLDMTEREWVMKLVELAEDQIELCNAGDGKKWDADKKEWI